MDRTVIERSLDAPLSRGMTALVVATVLFLSALPACAQAGGVPLATYLGPDREQQLIAGAKKEGELMVYSSMQQESIALLQKAFEDKYGIRMRIWRGAGKDILRRVTTEAKASRFDLDIVESDGFALEALYRERLLQEVRSPHHGDLIAQALRPHAQWVGTRVNISTGVYNTNLVKKEMLPKTYPDLLNPAFKGMLGIETDDYDWFGMVVGLLGEERGLALFRDIVATNGLSVRKGHTMLTNLAAAGEVPIGLTIFMQNAEVAKKNGAPVDWFLIAPSVARANGVALARRAPHPHAALLFYDFMIGEGQQVLLRREFVPTSRKVSSVLDRIALHFIDPEIVLDGGAKWQKLYGEVVRNGGR
jgi:iron(III) transport system substrate-binding protein